jgi:hypothetical protein
LLSMGLREEAVLGVSEDRRAEGVLAMEPDLVLLPGVYHEASVAVHITAPREGRQK